MKKCSKCKKEYELSSKYWRVNKTTKDGFDYRCKTCNKKYDKEYKKRREKEEVGNTKEYAMYQGEKILGIGTAKEIADKLNTKVSTVLFYNSDAYRKRLEKRDSEENCRIVICLD